MTPSAIASDQDILGDALIDNVAVICSSLKACDYFTCVILFSFAQLLLR